MYSYNNTPTCINFTHINSFLRKLSECITYIKSITFEYFKYLHMYILNNRVIFSRKMEETKVAPPHQFTKETDIASFRSGWYIQEGRDMR